MGLVLGGGLLATLVYQLPKLGGLHVCLSEKMTDDGHANTLMMTMMVTIKAFTGRFLESSCCKNVNLTKAWINLSDVGFRPISVVCGQVMKGFAAYTGSVGHR